MKHTAAPWHVVMKTSELTDAALDWAVAKCEGRQFEAHESFLACHEDGDMNYSTNWEQGGPIIERECIFIAPTWDGEIAGSSARSSRTAWINGPTTLVAAMRCYVASKLGDKVEVPEELI